MTNYKRFRSAPFDSAQGRLESRALTGFASKRLWLQKQKQVPRLRKIIRVASDSAALGMTNYKRFRSGLFDFAQGRLESRALPGFASNVALRSILLPYYGSFSR